MERQRERERERERETDRGREREGEGEKLRMANITNSTFYIRAILSPHSCTQFPFLVLFLTHMYSVIYHDFIHDTV